MLKKTLFVCKLTFRNYTTISSRNATNKICRSINEAISDIRDGSTILLGGFGICGLPENLIDALVERQVKNLTIVTNNSGQPDWGVGRLIRKKQVKKLIAAYIGDNKESEEQFLNGELEVEITPQGTIAEKLRAAASGIPAFFTRTGVGTMIETGGIPQKFSIGGKNVEKYSTSKETRRFNNIDYILETALLADFAFVKAWKGDTMGNLVFNKSARNFNPLMCRAARTSIVEVEQIVQAGELDPQKVHLPGIYVDRLIQGNAYQKRIAKLVTREKYGNPMIENNENLEQFDIRHRIAKRAAEEFHGGMYVNLGVGIPNLCLKFIPENVGFQLQSENGVLGLGPYPTEDEVDPDLINAGKETATVLPGASYFSSDESFAMIRGGHIDITILGALQVSQFGDLANWTIPGKSMKGMGGAMDLVSAPGSRVIITMEHTAKTQLKILNQCTLPLTGKGVVKKIITEKCVFDISKESGLILTEIAKRVSIDEIKATTMCDFKVAEDLKLNAY